MAGTHVYFDGLNFYYGAVKRRPQLKWVDVERLSQLVLPHDSIGCVRYFTAIVTPRYPGDKAHERQNAYVRALRGLSTVEVKLGHFRSDDKWRAFADGDFAVEDLIRPHLRPKWLASLMFADAERRRTKPFTAAHVIVDEEKGSDVNLGAHLLHDALTGACTKALVVTNDSDLAEPVRLAVAHGVKVGIMNPRSNQPTKRLRQVASFVQPFRPEILTKCQLPNPAKDSKGREVHRPLEWT